MAASINDLITQATNVTRPSPTTLTAIRAIAASSITCNALTGWPTASAVHFIIYTTDTNGNKVAGSQVDCKGVVSGNTITNIVYKAGTDAGNGIGAIVEAAPTAAWADDLYSWGTQDHDTQGRHVKLTDTNGVKILGLGPIASAVNDVIIGNNITGKNPTITAEGTDSNVGINIVNKGTGISLIDGASPQKAFALFNWVESGCVWTGDSLGSTLNASMTAGVVWIGGKRLTVAVVTARAFTASKDTYIDFADNGDGTANITYTPVTNNAASPNLHNDGSNTPALYLRNGIIVTGAGSIAAAGSINQGEHDKVLPIASSIAYSVTDSLGNLICVRVPAPTLIGHREITANFSPGTTVETDITGLSLPIITTASRRVRLKIGICTYNTGSADNIQLRIKEGASTIYIAKYRTAALNSPELVVADYVIEPSAGLHTYKVSIQGGAANPAVEATSSGEPAYIEAEYV